MKFQLNCIFFYWDSPGIVVTQTGRNHYSQYVHEVELDTDNQTGTSCFLLYFSNPFWYSVFYVTCSS